MRRYNITVNGKTYEVEVEEIGGNLVPRGHIRPAAAAASTTAPVAPALESGVIPVFFCAWIPKMLLIFTNRCINIYIKVDESGVKGWKVDKVDNFVDN